MKTRIEKDSMGEIAVPEKALWGAQTQRSLENFKISEQPFPKLFIHSYAEEKKAAAIVNQQQGKLSKKNSTAIVKACNEIISGQHDAHFPLVIWQTGSGTQTNMNLNEVIANRANELNDSKRGSNSPVHPNDHVNLSQSSNDTFPTVMHLTTARQVNDSLLPALKLLLNTLQKKQKQYKGIIKSARTHLMDATPITLEQEFSAYFAQITFAKKNIEQSLLAVYELAIGGSAVGTGLNTSVNWADDMAAQLAKQLKLPFTSAPNKFSALSSHDALADLHSQLKLLASILLKMANDLRFMASGPRCGLNEISLPANEPGSSIMPGKVNPTQIEALSMVAIQVLANDVAVSMANSQGQFQLNVYKPLILKNIYESITLLSDAIKSFNKNCLSGIEANQAQLQFYMENTLMLVTALTPHIGYDKAAQAAKLAHEKNITLKQAVINLKLMSENEFEQWVKPETMLAPEQGG